MAITATEAETAGITFVGALLGYIAQAGFDLSTVNFEHGAVVGAIAAIGVLGYHAYTGNVAPAKP